MKPDDTPARLFHHGRIWTGDATQPEAQALLAVGERLVIVGSDVDVQAATPADVERIDLEGRRVVPGFVDAHWHFTTEGHAGLYGAGTTAELQRRLIDAASRLPPGAWLVDGGWAYSEFPDGVPHRRWIDDVVSDRPVWISARDGHMGVANAMALEVAGLGERSADPVNGKLVRDARGRLTGELNGMACYLVQDLIPPPTVQACEDALRALMAQASACGITAVQNLQGWDPSELAAVIGVTRSGQSTLRMRGCRWLGTKPNGRPRSDVPRRLPASFRGWLEFGSAKGVLDGTIDAGTALMREPLTDGRSGVAYFTASQLNALVARADRAGTQVMLHACGDGAIGQALDAFEHARRVNAAMTHERRHRIEHFDVPSDEDLRRARELGVVVCSQPNFAYPDDTNLNHYAPLLGPERDARSQNYRRIDEAGIVHAFASDYPVSSMDVLRAIHTAVTRRRRDGSRPWNASQAIDVAAALRHYTIDAAYAGFGEADKGSLAPGKYADFVVLSEDILDGDPDRLLSAQVERTVLGGRTVFDRRDASPALLARVTVGASPFESPRRACPHCLWRGFAPRPRAHSGAMRAAAHGALFSRA
jgi:predicted amidohydrolase YtcJ